MSEPWRAVFLASAGAWWGTCALALGAGALFRARLGVERARAAEGLLAPLADLAGTWLGAVAGAALLLGRRGFSGSWAAALGLVALLLALGLYHRAALLPSLAAARKRAAAAPGEARWDLECRGLERLSVRLRGGMLLLGAAALVLGAVQP